MAARETPNRPAATDDARGIDRRAAAAALGAGALAAWSAPAVLSRSAAGAATVGPPCAFCDVRNLVVNGNAESGVLTPWQPGTGTLNWFARLWTDINTLDINTPAGGGDDAFSVLNSSTNPHTASITQEVGFGPGCEDALVTLEAIVGGIATSAVSSTSTTSVSVDFLDSTAASLGPGTVGVLSVTATPGTQPTTPAPLSTSGFMPVGAVSAVVTVAWEGIGGLGISAGVADNIGLALSCIS